MPFKWPKLFRNAAEAAPQMRTGMLMVGSLIVMALSCVLFIGSTFAWFAETRSFGTSVIQSGDMELVLEIGGSALSPVPAESGAIPMSGLFGAAAWQPEAVFASPKLTVSNRGDVDAMYKLMFDFSCAETRNALPPLELLDIIDFCVVDELSDVRSIPWSSFDTMHFLDLRTGSGVIDPMTGDIIQSLPVGSSESFYVVARMRDDAPAAYSGLTMEKPFRLFILARQAEDDTDLWPAAF